MNQARKMKLRNRRMRRLLATLGVAAGLGMSAPAMAIETAGDLFVDLRASDPSAGTASWINLGTLGGGFTAVGAPSATIINGAPGVSFNGSGDAYVSAANAPAGLVGLDPTRSIEVWAWNPIIASEETLVSWGRRGGPDGSNMSFNYGNNGMYGAVGHWGGGTADMGWVDNSFTAGAPAAGVWHHLVYTYDGTTTRVYSDGVLSNSEVLGVGVINTHAGTNIAVASQWEPDGVTLTPGLKGSLTIGALRIHDGVLNDLQVAANYAEERPLYPLPAPELLPAGPVNRYSFSDTPEAALGILVDSVGGANGNVVGPGASISGGRLDLPGGSSATAPYGDLPNGLISGHQNLSIEGWVRVDSALNWSRIFDIGSSTNGEQSAPGDSGVGVNTLLFSANVGTTLNQRLELIGDAGSQRFDTVNTTVLGQEQHFVVTFDDANNLLMLYLDGELVNAVEALSSLSSINDINVWLGRSQWAGDNNLDGSYDEFRIYDYALTASQVLGNYQAGPDLVNVVPSPATFSMLVLGTVFAGLRRSRRRAD